MGEPSDPGANDTVWKPPMRVDYLGLEVAARTDGLDEIRAEESH
jgi:hypothetical protein